MGRAIGNLMCVQARDEGERDPETCLSSIFCGCVIAPQNVSQILFPEPVLYNAINKGMNCFSICKPISSVKKIDLCYAGGSVQGEGVTARIETLTTHDLDFFGISAIQNRNEEFEMTPLALNLRM